MPKRIVTTGGRDFTDEDMVNRVLNELNPRRIAQGGATGADALVRDWALRSGFLLVSAAEACHADPNDRLCVNYLAAWKLYGFKAGPLRNGRMLYRELPDLVVAFPGNKGTADCVRQARYVFGLKVHLATEDQ